jgi:iron complex transport system substrate-binding protein
LKRKHSLLWVLVALLTISIVVSAGCKKTEDKPVDAKVTVTDMMGREVTLPAEINSIAAVGPGPAINSLIFALGEGGKIVSGLPEFARNERWKYQYKFAPNLKDKPVVQTAEVTPNMEELLKLKPDVVFAMDAGTSCEANIKVMADAGLPTICLAWGNNTEEFKQSMDLVGKVLNQKALAEEYNKYFDDTIARVNKAVKNVPEEKKPRVLHLNVESMTSPHKITEWWISEAGGNSLTKEVRIGENIEISMEQLLKWDPEVIVVFAPGQVKALYNDSRFKDVSAVKNKRVYATPMGAHIWSTRTSEQPLMLLWAAKTFHPDAFNDLDLEAELISFYKHFYKYSMSAEEAQEILGGGPMPSKQ